MKITKRQLRRIIRESLHERDLHDGTPLPEPLGTNSWQEAVIHYLINDQPGQAKGIILTKWMVDDTWHMEEDVLEDMLIDLGPDATPEQVTAVSDEWIEGVRSAKWHPRTDAEREADWSQGADRRTDFTHYKEKFR
jgi:hypothetical protein